MILQGVLDEAMLMQFGQDAVISTALLGQKTPHDL